MHYRHSGNLICLHISGGFREIMWVFLKPFMVILAAFSLYSSHIAARTVFVCGDVNFEVETFLSYIFSCFVLLQGQNMVPYHWAGHS